MNGDKGHCGQTPQQKNDDAIEWYLLMNAERENKPRLKQHGTNSFYQIGCRCPECKKAHAIANKKYLKK